MKSFILAAIAVLVIGMTQVDPWFSMLVNAWPTTDPCGYSAGHNGCVKHKLLCPVW